MISTPVSLELGSSLSADRLIIQANYLAELAARDEAGIGAHGWSTQRTQDLLTRLTALREALDMLGHDVLVREAVEVHAAIERAREWGQRLTLYLHNAFDDDHPDARALLPPPATSLLERTLTWLTPLLALARKHEIALSEWGGGTLFAQDGEVLCARLRQYRSLGIHPAQLSSSEQRLVELKCELFFMLKRLERCGRALWIEAPQMALRYHLRYLDPRNRVPAELAQAGTGHSATFRIESLGIEGDPRDQPHMDEDFRLETVAHKPPYPPGLEEVPRVARGWYHSNEEYAEGELAAAMLQGDREHATSIESGMAVGTEWKTYHDPDARMPGRIKPTAPQKDRAMPGKQGAGGS